MRKLFIVILAVVVTGCAAKESVDLRPYIVALSQANMHLRERIEKLEAKTGLATPTPTPVKK